MFFVLNQLPDNYNDYQDSILLIKDNWDDWFQFETQFFVYYITPSRELCEIGNTKIGQAEMPSWQRSPNIPSRFTALSDDFFSLGQSDFYYERISQLGDSCRERILAGLRDIAFFPELYTKVRYYKVTKVSLMRDVTHFMVTHQYQRIAKGNARLTKYEIEYTYPCTDDSDVVTLHFNVIPDSNPPTNIHVIIGRNNVGKTHLIKNIISAIYSIDDGKEHGILRSTNSSTGRLVSARNQAFANVLCVSFSPFDDYSEILTHVRRRTAMPFTYIGINQQPSEKSEAESVPSPIPLSKILEHDFRTSLDRCLQSNRKREMLNKTIQVLESDPVFMHSQLRSLLIENNVLTPQKNAGKIFSRLSSGHQVIMLTLVQLIDYLTERTFVILDEPENHLHPPLLSAFIRALSELLINYNGVALIATHSPVILQEVPRSCVWKIDRSGSKVSANRLEIESFGATIGSLTREVFGLEVRESGFHKILCEEVKSGHSYEEIVERFNRELGDEALALLHTLIMLNNKDQL